MEKTKTVSESRTEIAELMMPEHANPAGNVFGGEIVRLVDQAAGIVAARHCHRNVVTASIDRLDFINPAYVGNVITVKASLNFIGETSMEIGVRVDDECLITGNKAHIASAYLTYVALDENDKPVKIPDLILETEEDRKRYEEAKARREKRMKRIPKEERRKEGPCIQRPNKIN